MIARLSFLFLLLVLVASPAAAADWADVVGSLEHGITRILMSNGADSASCTGVVVNADRGYVVSAAHCTAADPAAGFGYTVDGRDAKIVVVNRQLDLVVFKTKLRRGAAAVTLAPAAPRVGSAVAVLGYPFGARSLTSQTGIFANADVDGWAWINADLLPGDSGGAIVDGTGALVGLTDGYVFNGAAHMGVAVQLETLRDFIDPYVDAGGK